LSHDIIAASFSLDFSVLFCALNHLMEPEWEPVDTWHAGYNRWIDRLPTWARFIFLPVDIGIILLAFIQCGWVALTTRNS